MRGRRRANRRPQRGFDVLFPAPIRFGIDGNPPPPRSNLVVVGIFSPSAAHPRKSRATITTPNTLEVYSRFPCRPASAARFAWTVFLKSGNWDSAVGPFPQPYHNIL